mgnify:CR=1 FL=1
MENRENVQELHKKHSDHLKINITGVRFYDTYIYFLRHFIEKRHLCHGSVHHLILTIITLQHQTTE